MIIKNQIIVDRESVLNQVDKAERLAVSDMNARGWLFDILSCVDRVPNNSFTLSQMYAFADELAVKHPENNNIKPKIRQQLQVLRDRGIIEFIEPGQYRKVL